MVIPYASDSIYVLWSSEKLNKNSPELASIFRGTVTATAASLSAELAQNNIYDFSTQLFGGLATTVSEIGLNAIISALFTPSKKMYVLEARLKHETDYMLSGTITYKYKDISADKDLSKEKTIRSKVSFARWLPESNSVFTAQWYMPILHPMNKIAPKDYKKYKDTRYAYCRNSIGKGKMFPAKSATAYNVDQYKWLMIYNDSVLRSQGHQGTVFEKTKPYIGIMYSNLDENIQKKTTLAEGVYVCDIDKMSAAYVGGLKEGDIILSVNGQIIKDSEDMNMIVNRLKVGDWLSFHVLRGKKEKDFTIRVTWK